LYAFLDPTCSVCRAMEPAIERLAQEYNVIVFPVSVVNDGGNAVEKIVPLLCQKDAAKRAAGWQALFRADAGMSVPGSSSAPVDPECGKAAEAAVAVNDLGFRQFGFEGTPWVLTDTGFRLSTGLLAEPAKIDLFLKTTDQMQPEQADRFLKT
ncbi:TPA: DsbC family protein, partial [Salmonella enterica]